MKVAHKQNIRRVLAKVYGIFPSLKNSITILMYHSVNKNMPYSVTPEMFDYQMQILARDYYVLRICDLGELDSNAMLQSRKKIAVVTFDDGYIDNAQYALPILKKNGIRATFFICSGYVNKKLDITRKFINYLDLKPLTRTHLQDLVNNGMEIGAHTVTHSMLSKLDCWQQENELVSSKAWLEDAIGQKVVSFAYPYGWPRSFNSNTTKLVDKYFDYCCTTIWRSNRFSDITKLNMKALSRIRIDAFDTQRDFLNKLNGSWDYMAYIQLYAKIIEQDLRNCQVLS